MSNNITNLSYYTPPLELLLILLEALHNFKSVQKSSRDDFKLKVVKFIHFLFIKTLQHLLGYYTLNKVYKFPTKCQTTRKKR